MYLRVPFDARESQQEGDSSYNEAAMSLIDTFERIRPSIVALASRLAQTRVGEQPAFPNIIGTGFVVDARGIVMTNRHVADALQELPPTCAMAIVFPHVELGNEERAQPVLFRQVRAYNLLQEFHSNGPFYGELLPLRIENELLPKK